MDEVRPAITVLGGKRTPHILLSIGTVVMALWALGSLGWLVMDLMGGATGTFESRGSELPLWAVLAVTTVVASYATWDTYKGAVMTGPNHGLIDYVSEAAGIRLTRMRAWGRALDVVVQRGESVEIGAVLEYQRRGGLERHYRFTVSAPAGSFTFSQAVHIEKLSLTPLDEAARQLGIRVETSGEAVVMERLPVA